MIRRVRSYRFRPKANDRPVIADLKKIYLAPTLLGSGTPALNGLGIGTLAGAQRWEWDAASGGAVQQLGRDLRLHLLPERPAGPHQTTPLSAAQSTSTDSLPARAAAGTAMGGY